MLPSVSWGEEWLGSPLRGAAQHREEGPKTSQEWLMMGELAEDRKSLTLLSR